MNRKQIVKALREAGYKAYNSGIPYESCPEVHMDAYQWRQGWLTARDSDDRANDESLEENVNE